MAKAAPSAAASSAAPAAGTTPPGGAGAAAAAASAPPKAGLKVWLPTIATLLLAPVCTWAVGQFVLIYPESHLFTIAVFIVLGRYAGYRITELWRFRDLVTHSENTP